jgi:hypothetical protein
MIGENVPGLLKSMVTAMIRQECTAEYSEAAQRPKTVHMTVDYGNVAVLCSSTLFGILL